MLFVGRQKETHLIITFLNRGRNVIVSGQFGIGRTSLIRHIAESAKNQQQFAVVDFSQNPRNVTQDLLKVFQSEDTYKKSSRSLGYKQLRRRLIHLESQHKKRPVLVLDNIAKLSPQKLALIRYLNSENKFLFIAIVENFIRDRDLFKLRAQLIPAELVKLTYLNIQYTKEFFNALSEENDLCWPKEHINMLAQITRGYPLGMIEIAERSIKRH
ncbi:MAG: ATP-binding protein [Syntrophales bacterium]|jgi:replication-associated recombination protein RarA